MLQILNVDQIAVLANFISCLSAKMAVWQYKPETPEYQMNKELSQDDWLTPLYFIYLL